MSELVDRIRGQGHWRMLVRPATFDEERIPTLSACEQVVDKCQVRQRGWYFPHTDSSRLQRRLDYIELETDFPHHPEAWRFYQSGQFVFVKALGEDNLDKYRGGSGAAAAKPGEWLGVLSTLYQLSEIYEFVARLAQDGVLGDQLAVSITLNRLKGRQMAFESPDRSMGDNCKCIEDSLPRLKTYSVADLVSRARELALEHFLWITERFQCPGTERVFRSDQEKFFEGRY